jgi:hypothetical protein
VTAIVTLVSLALCLVTLQSPPKEQVGARDRWFMKPPTEEIMALTEKLLSIFTVWIIFNLSWDQRFYCSFRFEYSLKINKKLCMFA